MIEKVTILNKYMPSTIHHMSIDVRGALNWKPKMLCKLFRNHDGTAPKIEAVRNFLYDKLKEGYEVIPMGAVECEGFDKINGCPGHSVESKD